MPRPIDRRHPWLFALAVALGLVVAIYSAVWIKTVSTFPSSRLGVDYEYRVKEAALELSDIVEGSAADRAGLQAGDRLLSAAGRPFTDLTPLYDEIVMVPAGTAVLLEVARPGVAEPLRLTVVTDPWRTDPTPLAQRIANRVMNLFPLPFLIVGFAVLLQRPRDRHAWLLALVFTGLIASAPFVENEYGCPPAWRGFALTFVILFANASSALFYFFFAVFPAPSPLERRLPWLKWSLLALQATISVPLAAWTALAGSSRPLYLVDHLVDTHANWFNWLLTVAAFGAYGLGLVSLLLNARRGSEARLRRRARVVLTGMAAGLLPFLVLQLVGMAQRRVYYEYPFWIWSACVIAVLLIPFAFAYAVLRHQVLEIPVLLRRSARYLLVQRGFLALLVLVAVAVVALVAVMLEDRSEAGAVSIGLGAAAAGVGVAWALGRLHARIARRIDRAFFRSAYDAQQILEDLIVSSRDAPDQETLRDLLRERLQEALEPQSLSIYLRQGERLAHDGRNGAALPARGPLAAALLEHGRVWDADADPQTPLAAAVAEAGLAATCVAAFLGRHGELLGLAALGPRRSEEPYSQHDRRLLASVAGQVGLTLQSFAMAEEIVERTEEQRRLERELEYARQVQANLLPREVLPLPSLDYTARCIQAHAVGGDFYDYLSLGEGRLGLVLADISGKGMSAALLMANLQATLRSRAVDLAGDPVAVMQDVNRSLIASTEPGQFATLFLGLYDDASRRLTYVNCGHNPPLVLRRDGGCEELAATATVLGAFDTWACEAATLELAAEDLLVAYSDGVTETTDPAGEMFGEERLLATVRAHREQPLDGLVAGIIEAATSHGGGVADDDLTLLVGRVR